MITDDYVSFELAKLLKEKGFDEDVLITDWWYDADGMSYKRGNYSYSGAPHYYKETCFNCPTHQLVLKWLRKVHNIHVAVIVAYHHIPRRYEAHIMKLDNIDDFILNPQVDFASYEEACEASIKYCLEKLI